MVLPPLHVSSLLFPDLGPRREKEVRSAKGVAALSASPSSSRLKVVGFRVRDLAADISKFEVAEVPPPLTSRTSQLLHIKFNVFQQNKQTQHIDSTLVAQGGALVIRGGG